MTHPVAWWLVALLCVGAGAAQADSKEAYKLGIEALEAGRWSDAEGFFRSALAERPDERVHRLLKTVYLPHYYLGVALAEQGDCRAALSAFSQSQGQGQIEKSKLGEDLDRRRTACHNHLQHVASATAEVERLVEKVGGVSQALAALSRAPQLAPSWDRGRPSLSSRRQQADDRLAAARQALDKGKSETDLERLDAAKGLATQALAELEQTLAAARSRLGEVDAARASAVEQAVEELEQTEESARRTLRSIGDLAPYPERLGKRVAAVERALEASAARPPNAEPKLLADLATQLTAARQSLRRAARRPPKELALAARALFAGAFEETIRLLTDEGLATDSRAAPHVCLLRAAAYYGQWVAGGERDEALHGLAVRDVTDCGGTKPALAPSRDFFSPRFVDFHLATLTAAAAPATPDEGDGG